MYFYTKLSTAASSSYNLLLFVAFNCLTRTAFAFRRHPSFSNSHHDNDQDNIIIIPPSTSRLDPNRHVEIIQNIVESIDNAATEDIHRELSPDDDQKNKKGNVLIKPNDHLVTDLPYLENGVFQTKHYAGHIPASNSDDDKKFFYWLFEPDFADSSVGHNGDDDIPLLIWLNGGPGCSSMDGLFLENGPFRLTKKEENNWTMQINPYSWHKAPAYVLYIDQPVGTGLSFTKKGNYCKNDLEINIDFHLFLENFLIMYHDYFLNSDDNNGSGQNQQQRTMRRPLYFSGESHAGHYIPSMMDYILQRNDDTNKATSPRVLINLKGGAIGNGWIDPYYQYAAADIAYSIGMIDLAQKQYLDDKEEKCRAHLLHGTYRSNVCFDLLDDVIADSSGKNGKTELSIYDNRKWETSGKTRSFPPGHKDVEAYLGGWHQSSIGMTIPYEDVLKAIHAEESIDAKQRFKECTDPPYIALQDQDGKGVVKELVNVLEHTTKPKMLIFNGMNDMICNHIGNEKVLDNLNWKHIKPWTLSKRYAWNYKSDFVHSIDESGKIGPAGYYKEYENLIFLKIAASGHMVPMDLPDLALEMMRKFMFQESFAGDFQRLDGILPKSNEGKTECQSCPTCPSTTEKSITNENKKEDDDDIEETDESRVLFSKEFVSGGWFGAFIAVSIMVLYNAIKSQRTSVHHVSSNNIDGYRDDPEEETELVLTSRNKVVDDGEYII